MGKLKLIYGTVPYLYTTTPKLIYGSIPFVTTPLPLITPEPPPPPTGEIASIDGVAYNTISNFSGTSTSLAYSINGYLV